MSSSHTRARDNHRRSFAKAVSWRITGTVDTILISWIITRRFTLAISIGLVEVFTKIIIYYFHERIWDKIRWGRAQTASE